MNFKYLTKPLTYVIQPLREADVPTQALIACGGLPSHLTKPLTYVF